MPWAVLCEAIEPYYSKPGNARSPIGLERRFLRINRKMWISDILLFCRQVAEQDAEFQRVGVSSRSDLGIGAYSAVAGKGISQIQALGGEQLADG